MTPAELKVLIDSDQTATELAAIGNDTACAERCTVIATPIISELRLSEIGILSLYSDPSIGESVLAQIDNVAKTNPIVARIAKFIGPNVHPSCLVDWSVASIRSALTLPVEAGGLGLTDVQADPILKAAEKPQPISTNDVSAAMQSVRTNA